MPDRELARAHNSEDGHGFRSTVHPRPPALAEQQQDRGDQGSGVTDTYPPYEVGDIPTPSNGLVQVPLSDTVSDLTIDTIHPEKKQRHTDIKTDIPEAARFHFNWLDDVFGNLVVILITINQRFPEL
ncbi:MAG: hypothetical protein U0T56_07280 [Ferruginibacter sp.]